jgi:AbrB family transcriptional regulator, stage V sporulation protein T
MKKTGIVRRIDELGRIVIPKEIRKTMRIRSGESIEIYIEDNNIILKKYSPMNDFEEFARKYVDSVYTTLKQNIIITDRDDIIAVAGPLKKKYLGKPISEYLENGILRRDNFVEKHVKDIEIITDEKEVATYAFSPILVNGDVVGLVLILSLNNILTEIEEKTAQITAQFLGKHMEI